MPASHLLSGNKNTDSISFRHRWDLSIRQAMALQKKWAPKVIRNNQRPSNVSTVAGIDVAYGDGWAVAAVAVLHYPELTLQERGLGGCPATFPYLPGLLSFREGPAVITALERLTTLPDLIIFDGQGIAHPRRLGLASHMGLLLDVPTLGCAKTCLCGHFTPPDDKRGAYTFLIHRSEVIGAVLRTRRHVKPLFVSIGHRIDLSSVVQIVLNCCKGYRLPEPVRIAHQLAQSRLRQPDSTAQPSIMPPQAAAHG